ncbi:phage tail tape measure protein [Savagea sp. SN6]|uniref:Phage tail tape measure protein n=1 Tax=Savagea serpentis TaxID=2785297 RepID=A0A8J7G213_9BACL|nr:phage tail tape measure protein [Savagea serpentis]MBF4500237.1 phage tail tape measure protein [Savagea serpentis]
MSRRIKGITIEVDGETKGLDKALEGVNKKSRDIQKELRDVDRLLKFNPKNVELLTQKKKLLADQVKATGDKLKGLKDAQEQVTQAFKNGEISEEQYRNFQREIAETESKLKHYENQLKKVDSSQRTFAEKMAESGKKVKEFGQGMQSVGKELSMKVTAPLVALGGVATKIGMDFKAGLSEVQAISGATASEMAQLEVKARELGSSTKFSASEVTDAFKYMSMAGWDVQQSISAVDGVLSLAAASGEDLALVADIVTDGMTAFGLEAKEAGRFSDVLASASSSANTNVAMLSESFKYVAPVAGALGYSVEDTALALGLMANAGIKSSQSGTSLRASLTNLVKPTKAMQNVMDDLGINIKDANGEMKPMEVLLRDLRTAFSTLTEDQKASAAATIFGKEAMAGMLAIINASEEDFNNLSNSINNSNGVAKEMADTMQNNLKGQITNLKSALEELAIKLYDNLEPALKGIVGAIQGAVDKLNAMSPAMQKVVVGIGVLLASLGPLMIVGGTLLVGIGQIMTMLPVLLPMISALAGPIGIVVGAITALGVAYALMQPKADEALIQQQKLAEAELEVARATTEAKDAKLADIDATTEKANSVLSAIQNNNKLVESFEALSAKNKLSNEELLKFRTLNSELEHTTSPEAIAKIQGEMEELKNKSGLTNEEFNTFMSTQDSLAQQLPDTALLYDEYGNAVIGVTDNIKALTEAELERMRIEVYEEMLADIQEINTELQAQDQLLDDIYNTEIAIEEATKATTEAKSEIAELEKESARIGAELEQLAEGKSAWEKLTSREYIKQKDELLLQKSSLDGKIKKAQKNLEVEQESLATNKETLEELKNQQSQNNESIKKSNEQYDVLLKIHSESTGITLEKGKEVEQIDKAINANKKDLTELENKKKTQGDTNGEIQKAIDKRNEENRKLTEAKTDLSTIRKSNQEINDKVTEGNKNLAKRREEHVQEGRKIEENKRKAEQQNTVLGKDIKKKVEINQTKDPDVENSKWSKGITKVISFFTKGKAPDAYAVGTNFHTGGQAFMGEEGLELFKANGKYGIADFGLYDLPVGAKVWTADQTKSILKNGLIDGIGKGVTAQKQQSINQTINIEPAPIILDGQVIGHATFSTINNNMGKQQNLDNYLKGV